MHEAAARALAAAGWLTWPEATFSIYGERGVIDVLAFHPTARALLVVELKTDVVDVQALIGTVDRYRRLAPRVARERGWDAPEASCWVLLRDTATNRRRVAAHAGVLRTALPSDGRRMRRWLANPSGSVRALLFLANVHQDRLGRTSSGVRRVRVVAASVAPRRNHRSLAPGENEPVNAAGKAR